MTDAGNTRPVALITGAARRVGATLASTLHAAGYDLALHYRHSRSEIEVLAAELQAMRPASVLLLQAELADVEKLPLMIDSTISRFGHLDALINNASAFYPTTLGSVTPTHWDELFASNARAPFFLAQAAAPYLRESRGAIVNLLDIYAERPLSGYSVYCMAKAAQATMTLALANELGPDVRVNGVAPGAVLWPETKSYANQQEVIARTPLKRAGSPADVAGAVLWLLRDAHFTTGQILRVDGGRTLPI